MRLASRTDGNHADVIDALRKIGARAVYIRQPVDLLVGYRNVNVLLEVKDGSKSESRRKLTAQEAEFIATWPGLVRVVISPEDAVLAVIEAATR